MSDQRGLGRRATARSYAVRLTVVLALLVGLYADDEFGRVLEPLTGATVRATQSILGTLGVETVRKGGELAVPGGFSYEIYFRCTGYLPVACLAAAILLAPLPLRRKLPGLLVGGALLLAFNLFRLVHLFLVGVSSPEMFRALHRCAWEPVTGAAVLVFWLLWRRRVGL